MFARPARTAIVTALLAGFQTLCPAQEQPPQQGASADAQPARATERRVPEAAAAGQPEVAHEFHGPMPTGVTVSHDGRVFVNYPRWEDPIQFTVAEIKDGKEVPYPNQEANGDQKPDQLFSVQSVVVDPQNRLWALDTGSVEMGPIKGQEWAKLVCIDLNSNQVVKAIRFPENVVLKSTYLNDVRFDLTRGEGGMAFITDSSSQGPNGIIVVDLASGRSWRKLNDHPSTKAEPGFKVELDGKPLMLDKPGEDPKPATVGSDGIAISADGKRLYYCPLSGFGLYSVSVDALADEQMGDEEVAKTVTKEAQRDFASDGLESDAQGRLYLTDYTHNAVRVRTPDGKFSIFAQDDRLLWPDTLSLGTDGSLYVTANQLHRQKKFNDGQDKRQKPYYLFKIKTDGKPVMLKK